MPGEGCTMNHAIQCRCGRVNGSMSHTDQAVRAVCPVACL